MLCTQRSLGLCIGRARHPVEVVFCLSLQMRSVLGRCQEVALYLEEADLNMHCYMDGLTPLKYAAVSVFRCAACSGAAKKSLCTSLYQTCCAQAPAQALNKPCIDRVRHPVEVVFCLRLQMRGVLGRCQEVPLHLEEAGSKLHC